MKNFYPNFIDKKSKMEKFLFILACKNQGASKTDQIKNVVKDVALGAVALKVFGAFQYWWLIVGFGIFYIFFQIIFGKFLIDKKVIEREGSISNRISNPELMKMYNGNQNG